MLNTIGKSLKDFKSSKVTLFAFHSDWSSLSTHCLPGALCITFTALKKKKKKRQFDQGMQLKITETHPPLFW
jgi:hypothetical protein